MPKIRADIIDLYIFRRTADTAIELLQLHRSSSTRGWHPIMGHMEQGETAIHCLQREMFEEVGLMHTSEEILGLWALEQVHPYFVPEWDSVVLSPRFCAEVTSAWEPTLNHEHSAHRWIAAAQAEAAFQWPGQRAAISELQQMLADPRLLKALRINT